MTYDFLMLVGILEFMIIVYLVFIALRLKKLCNILMYEIINNLSGVSVTIREKDNGTF